MLESDLAALLAIMTAVCRPGNLLVLSRARELATVFDEKLQDTTYCIRIVVVVDKEKFMKTIKNLDDNEKELLLEFMGGCKDVDPFDRSICIAFNLSMLTSVLDGLGVPYTTTLVGCGEELSAERIDVSAIT